MRFEKLRGLAVWRKCMRNKGCRGAGEVGLQLQRFLVRVDGLFNVAMIAKDIAEISVQRRIVRPKLNGFSRGDEGFIKLAYRLFQRSRDS